MLTCLITVAAIRLKYDVLQYVFFPYMLHYQDHRYMAEILPIWRKTLFIQSINQSIIHYLDPFEDLWHLTLKLRSMRRKYFLCD